MKISVDTSVVKNICNVCPKEVEATHGNFYRLFWQKMYTTYSLFEQMYGNFYRYLVVKIICSFCPKRYMEITVDVIAIVNFRNCVRSIVVFD